MDNWSVVAKGWKEGTGELGWRSEMVLGNTVMMDAGHRPLSNPQSFTAESKS